MRYIDKLKYTESHTQQGHTYTFTGSCLVTKKEYSVTVKGSELFAMRQTDNIMALTSLKDADREFLISGTSPEGWEEIFGGND